MNIFEILFYLLITGGVAYLVYISRNFINSNSDEVDQLKTNQFILVYYKKQNNLFWYLFRLRRFCGVLFL